MTLPRDFYQAFVGQRFGKRVVIGLTIGKGPSSYYFVCKCDCGNEHVVRRHQFLRDHERCLKCIYPDDKKPGVGGNRDYPSWQARRNNPEYRAWANMLSRCFVVSNHKYPDYGGRGITVCEHWRHGDKKGYPQFLADMGKKPEKHLQLDRINNDLGYLCPRCHPPNGNCRWTTPSEQGKNKRPVHRARRERSFQRSKEWRENQRKGLLAFWATVSMEQKENIRRASLAGKARLRVASLYPRLPFSLRPAFFLVQKLDIRENLV